MINERRSRTIIEATSELSLGRRVVAIQGGVQLASALAAMRRADRSPGMRPWENHLIIHDLSAPEDQAVDFAACLTELARQAEDWASWHYIPKAEMVQLNEAFKSEGEAATTRLLRRKLGIEHCHQLLLGQNLKLLNHALYQCFPEAEPACYGDGIGLNFSPQYFKPVEPQTRKRVSVGRAIERWVRKRWKALRGIPPKPVAEDSSLTRFAIPFRKHYLLLANHFDQQVDQFEQLDWQDFRQLFTIFGRDIDQRAPITCRDLQAALTDTSSIVVLLTSNFSETQRMTRAAEIECYLDMLKRYPRKQAAALVIKPHPRDSLEKIRAIQDQAQKIFQRVVTLSDPWTFFIPFESIFERFFLSDPRIAGRTTVACSSSACISLELLYGQRCDVGFGREAIHRFFDPKWQALRERHEADLSRLVQVIRQQSSSRSAA
jgi:hypothetical protein